MSDIPLTRDQFLERKRDYSPFLVHLTKSTPIDNAKEVLCHILDNGVLLALNAWCIWYKNLGENSNADLCEKFKVVCFTETPLGQIDIILKGVQNRMYQPEPYGLVFSKTFIRDKDGNPVFYVKRKIAKPLSELYANQKNIIDADMCRFLALTTICEKYNDWHWEREWRIVGELRFKPENVYCGLCPQEDIPFFEGKYKGITFIDPLWRMNKILDQLVEKAKKAVPLLEPDDIPF